MLALHQLDGALRQAGRCDRHVLIAGVFKPAVFLGVGLRFYGLHHGTGPRHRLQQARLGDRPVFSWVELSKGSKEGLQLALLFQLDF